MLALERKDGPSVIALSRQPLPYIRSTEAKFNENYSSKGAYVVESEEGAEITIIASGSEVSLAREACQKLKYESIRTRLISMPCMEIFANSSNEYRSTILGNKPKIIIEAGSRQSWMEWMNEKDIFIGMEDFGESGVADDIFNHFNITSERVYKEAKFLLKK